MCEDYTVREAKKLIYANEGGYFTPPGFSGRIRGAGDAKDKGIDFVQVLVEPEVEEPTMATTAADGMERRQAGRDYYTKEEIDERLKALFDHLDKPDPLPNTAALRLRFLS
jgi:hypothetical protein